MRLIEWGAASLETSVNQPTLPQLVIVVNAATVNVATQQEWDVDYATENLLRSVRPSLQKKTYFKNLAQSWSSKGWRIDSIDDLIRCYYSSFSVVRIPAEGRYTLLDRQIGALGHTINTCCKESFNAKRRANMLSNSDELSIFLHSAFDHFTRDLQTPFNFIEISRRNNVSCKNGRTTSHAHINFSPFHRILVGIFSSWLFLFTSKTLKRTGRRYFICSATLWLRVCYWTVFVIGKVRISTKLAHP